MADLAGIPVPESEGLQGKSLVPVLSAPATGTVHAVALSQFPRCWQNETQVNGGKKCGDEQNRTNSPENICKDLDTVSWSLQPALPKA